MLGFKIGWNEGQKPNLKSEHWNECSMNDDSFIVGRRIPEKSKQESFPAFLQKLPFSTFLYYIDHIFCK